MNDQTQTAVAKRDDAPKPALASGGKLAALVPQSIDEAYRLSQALARGGDMVPKHFQDKPEQIMAAVLRGMEVGLAPMQALSNIAVINGRATIWGDAIPALMQRKGHQIDVQVTGEGEGMVATATLIRADTGQTIVRTFSVEDAKKAGLWGKQGPWQQYPKRMLSHRARAWAVRDGAADALMGLEVAEEQQDVPMRDVTPREPGGFAQKAVAARAPVDTPEPEEAAPTPAESVPEPVEDAEVLPPEEPPVEDVPQEEPQRDPVAIRDGMLKALSGVQTPDEFRDLTMSNRWNDAHMWLLENDQPKGLEITARMDAVRKTIEGESA